jgi:hypothetical protein
MRLGSGVRLVRLCLAAVALVAFVGSASTSAATVHIVGVTVDFTGAGTVRVNHAFTCHVKVVGAPRTCRHTFHVRRGRWIVVKASPKAGWKLTVWGGVPTGVEADPKSVSTPCRSCSWVT